MKIEIIEQLQIIEGRYLISVNEKPNYVAEGNFGFLGNMNIDTLAEERVMSIFNVFLSITPSYNIYVNNDKISTRKEALKFRTKSYFKNHYYCTWNNDKYDIYVHKKLRYSIFKNNIQIAGLSEERWKMLDQESFKLECDYDCQKELLIAFSLILSNLYYRKTNFLGGLFSYSHGVFFEKRQCNDKWKPKQKV